MTSNPKTADMPYRFFLLLLACALTPLLAGHQTALGTDDAEAADDDGFVDLFDGETLDGWEGDRTWFRVEDGAIVAGSLEKRVTKTVFLNTTKSYYNFELRYQLMIKGPRQHANGGVQFRSVRDKDKPARVIGYQVDAGQAYWGRLYDEGRRKKLLTDLPEDFSIDDDVRHGQWNDYRVLVRDNRVKIWLNGTLVGDYTEDDQDIAKQTGFIAVQAHAGSASEIWYRKLQIKPLD